MSTPHPHPPPQPHPPIQHLVLSGGGHYGFAFLGILEASHQGGFWNWSQLKSIHGTSVGALIGAVLCLKYDWDILSKYFIQRPWGEVFSITPDRCLEAYEKNGLFQEEFVSLILEPLLKGKDLHLDITLVEFWEKTGIEWVGTTFELHQHQAVQLSYHTHPHLSLVNAIYRSCAIPILFTPVCTDKGECFLDGALYENYPIPTDIPPAHIMGIRTCPSPSEENSGGKITSKSNLYETMMVLTQSLLLPSTVTTARTDLGAEFIFYQTGWGDFLTDFQSCFLEEDARKQYYLRGKQVVMNYKSK